MTAIDVVAKWAIDAALFLVAAAGFMVASFAGDLAARAIISITVGIVVGLLLEQITSTLPSSARLANVSALPDGVRRMSRGRYAFEGTCWFVPVYALVAVLAWAWGDPKLYGWLGDGLRRLRSSACTAPSGRAASNSSTGSCSSSAWARGAAAWSATTPRALREPHFHPRRMRPEDDPRVRGGPGAVATQAGGEALVHRPAPDRAAHIDPHDGDGAPSAHDLCRDLRPVVKDREAELLPPRHTSEERLVGAA